MAKAEPLRGDNVLLQMFRTSQAVRELLLRAMAGTGVTPDEYAVLSVIGALRAVSPTELAERLRIPPTSISRHVARLIDLGLVTRAPNPGDRRSYLLELTGDGRSSAQTIVPRFRRIAEQLRERVAIDDIEAALVDLERAARELDVDTTVR